MDLKSLLDDNKAKYGQVKSRRSIVFKGGDGRKLMNAKETTGAALLNNLAGPSTLPCKVTSATVEGAEDFFDEDLFRSVSDVSKVGELPVLTTHAAVVKPGDFQIGGNLSCTSSSEDDFDLLALLEDNENKYGKVKSTSKLMNAKETTGAALNNLAGAAVSKCPCTVTSATVEGAEDLYYEELLRRYGVPKAEELPVLTPHAVLVKPGDFQIGGNLSRKVGSRSDDDGNQKSLLENNEDTCGKVKPARVSDDNNNNPPPTPHPATEENLNTTTKVAAIVLDGTPTPSRTPWTPFKVIKRKKELAEPESEPVYKKISRNILSVLNASESGRKSFRSFTLSRLSIGGSGSSSLTDYTNVSSLNKRNAEGDTPLQIACRNGQLGRVQHFLDNGANTSVTDRAGWTPLHDAINGKGTPVDKAMIVKRLCESGANVNAMGGFDDDLPLHEAAQSGDEELVEILLRFGAYPNVRNKNRKLPRDVAFNRVIVQLLDDKRRRTSLLMDDFIIHGINLQKAQIYFCFEVPDEIIKAVKMRLNLKVADKVEAGVTHLIYYQFPEKDDDCLAPLSWDYLQGLGRGLWQLGYQWIEKSINYNKLLEMSEYEITGCKLPTTPSSPFDSYDWFTSMRGIPELARKNQEKMVPRLLDGMNFYLFGKDPYKRFSKKDLWHLIVAAGGKIARTQPDPNLIDPFEHLGRFHAKGVGERFILTSHFILYSEEAPPPESEKFTMEHVKTLKIEWLIDSIGNFALLNPDDYL